MSRRKHARRLASNTSNWRSRIDGLSVVVNPKNDWCECLTVDQLKAIWQPESSVSKWSDVDPKWPAEPIKLYGPGTDSGTFDYFTEKIVGKEGSSRDDFMASEDDNSLVTGVAGDTYALGYFGLAYYEENRDKLKLVGCGLGRRQLRRAHARDGARPLLPALVSAAFHLRAHQFAGASGGPEVRQVLYRQRERFGIAGRLRADAGG